MILIDTSVWIEFFNDPHGRIATAVEKLLRKSVPVCINAIIEMEILQGIKSDKDCDETRSYLSDFQYFSSVDKNHFDTSVDIYRTCRKRGITVRRSLDCLIAAHCLINDLEIMHHDRDFQNIKKAFNSLKVLSV